MTKDKVTGKKSILETLKKEWDESAHPPFKYINLKTKAPPGPHPKVPGFTPPATGTPAQEFQGKRKIDRPKPK